MDIQERLEALHKDAIFMHQKARHEQELKDNHGQSGHKVAQVLHEIEAHALSIVKKSQPTPQRVMFSLTREQINILVASKRYKTIREIIDLTHEIIEGEVEHVIYFSYES